MTDNEGMEKRAKRDARVILTPDRDGRVAGLIERGWRIVGWVDGFYRIAPPRTAVRGHQTARSAPSADLANK